jgi:hypothetical protein
LGKDPLVPVLESLLAFFVVLVVAVPLAALA